MKVLVFKDIKNRRWTIWSPDRKRHLGYADEITLADAKFIVLLKDSKKIKKTKKRFPHAWIIGEITTKPSKCILPISYNPFTMETFEYFSGDPIHKAKNVFLTSDGMVFV